MIPELAECHDTLIFAEKIREDARVCHPHGGRGIGDVEAHVEAVVLACDAACHHQAADAHVDAAGRFSGGNLGRAVEIQHILANGIQAERRRQRDSGQYDSDEDHPLPAGGHPLRAGGAKRAASPCVSGSPTALHP